jgi:hypothetical protein
VCCECAVIWWIFTLGFDGRVALFNFQCMFYHNCVMKIRFRRLLVLCVRACFGYLVFAAQL